jgi:hypothetical protein
MLTEPRQTGVHRKTPGGGCADSGAPNDGKGDGAGDWSGAGGESRGGAGLGAAAGVGAAGPRGFGATSCALIAQPTARSSDAIALPSSASTWIV